MKSWKTTTMGVCSILTALIGAVTAVMNGQPVPWESTIAAVVAGIGLISAKDHNVTNAPNPVDAQKV